MKPPPFEYLRPSSLEEALKIKSQHGDEAKVLAGGQSLIPTMNFRMVQPSLLVDLNEIAELDHLNVDGEGHLQIGAMTRQRRVELDPLAEEISPLLHETMPFIAHPQIRNRGTIGGSLVHADPASELPVIALATQAKLRLVNHAGDRWIASRDFLQGMFMTDLGPDEILVEIKIPPMPKRTGWSFQEVSRRRGDYAMMGVAALVTLNGNGRCKDARLVYLNAGDGPMQAHTAEEKLKGEKGTETVFDAVAEHASQEDIDPFGSIHATVEYQRHLANVLTKRALRQAFNRAEAA
jgi:carbon-monoxide dehydrogenase medium subunit